MHRSDCRTAGIFAVMRESAGSPFTLERLKNSLSSLQSASKLNQSRLAMVSPGPTFSLVRFFHLGSRRRQKVDRE